ncbi:MAG: two-component regulator propeller domain-containing protein [Balneola sp.]
MRVRLNGWIILLVVVLNVSAFLKVSGQSQQYPPSFISNEFLFQNWTARDGLPVNSLSSVTQTADGYIWLGTEDGLVRFDGIDFKIFTTNEYPGLRNNRIRGVTFYSDKLLILNSNMEFILFDGREFELLPLPDSLTTRIFTGIIRQDSGEILFPTISQEIYTIVDKRIQPAHQNSYGIVIERERDKFYWQAYKEELFLDGKPVLDLDNQINEVIKDREGTLWIATYSKGLYKIRPNLFETYSVEEGLPNRNVYPVLVAKDETVWVGTYGGGIATIKQVGVTKGYLFEGVSSALFVQSILERSNGDILVALLDKGIFKYSGDRIFMKYPSPDEGILLCLFEDSDQRLWAGTSSGLYYYELEKWHLVNYSALSNVSIKAIAEAPDKSLWLGTNGQGLVHLKGVLVQVISKNTGLSSNIIRSIWIKEDSRQGDYEVWAGSEDSGLNRIPVQNGDLVPLEVVSINTKNGLFDNVIHQILPDEFGRVWMSSNQGLFWVFYHDLEQFVRGNIDQITSTGFTEVDGLRNREANGGIQPAGAKDKNGVLWFPTQDGLVKVDPQIISRNIELPPVHISKVESQKKVFEPTAGSIELELGDRNLEFYFTVLSLVSPEKNKLKFRLFGYDEDWISVTGQNSVRYTNLPPGNYQFKVIGTNNDGVWNQQGAVVAITIPAYFYESVWFYVLIVFLLGIQVILVFLLARRRASKKMMEIDAELKAARELAGKLQSRLEDHSALKKLLLFNLGKDLRNPVVSLREQVELDREPIKKIVDRETQRMLSYIDQLLLLSEIEIEGIGLNPKPEDLVEVAKTSIRLHKNDVLGNDPVIEFTSNSDKVIVYIDLSLVLIILRNLISRMVNHSNVTKVRMQIIEESSICTLKISDNGTAISHDELHSIFELFKSNIRTRRMENNLGIELPLVSKLVELHNASIVVHAVPDGGNTFSIIFKKGSQHFNYQDQNPKTEKK